MTDIARAQHGQFAPGASANPAGRPRIPESLVRAARQHTRQALSVLLKLMRGAKSESVKLRAAEIVLDRGWGKSVQAVQVDGQFLAKKLSEMSDAELQAFEQKLLERADRGDELPQADLFGGAGDFTGGRPN
jgi:hypothetical protein